jgi:hypothetical protein
MDFNKRREASSIAYWRISAEFGSSSKRFCVQSSELKESRMSDLGLQPREVRGQSGQLPAEERLGCSENTSDCLFLLLALALFEYMPLVRNADL